jgi:hypothetical protein
VSGDGIKEYMEFKVHVRRTGSINIKLVTFIDVMYLFRQLKIIDKQKKLPALL